MTEPAFNDGGSAFPVPDTHHPNGDFTYGANGMSLRDYFAGQALTSVPCRKWDVDGMGAEGVINAWAECAYRVADAMLKARVIK